VSDDEAATSLGLPRNNAADAEYVVGDEFNVWSGRSAKHDHLAAAAGELWRGSLEMPRVEVQHGSPTAVKRHGGSDGGVLASSARERKRLGAKLGSYRLPITATSAGLLPDRGAWDRLHHSISLPKLERLPLPADVHCRLDTAGGCL
jgi:hypothetical protein